MADESVQIKDAAAKLETAVTRIRWLSALLSDNGAVSSARLVMLLTAVVVLAKGIAFNVAAIMHGAGPVGFDATDIGILSAAMGGKVLQSIFAEAKK